MASLDSTFLIDLLRRDSAAVAHLDRLEGSREPRFVTPPAAAKVMVGAHGIGGRSLRVAENLVRSLQWLESDWESCRLAGRIEAELISRGEPMSASDLFIAAVTLRHGQRLVTRDRGFARVPGLRVETYWDSIDRHAGTFHGCPSRGGTGTLRSCPLPGCRNS